MIITIDFGTEVPLYQQIRDQVVRAIAFGRLEVGEALPSTRLLGADLGINFHTVNKAYDLLRNEGLVVLTRKSGAVVVRDPTSGFADEWSGRLRTLLAEGLAKGLSESAVLDACRQALVQSEEG